MQYSYIRIGLQSIRLSALYHISNIALYVGARDGENGGKGSAGGGGERGDGEKKSKDRRRVYGEKDRREIRTTTPKAFVSRELGWGFLAIREHGETPCDPLTYPP